MIVPEDVNTLLKNFARYFKMKNDQFGDSYSEPIKVFGSGSANALLGGRIDTILRRIATSQERGGNIKKKDVVNLVGNLVLLMLYKDWIDFEDLLDGDVNDHD